MKKKIILWGGFANGELYNERTKEGFNIPALFWTKKEATIYYEDVRKLEITYKSYKDD